MKKKTKPEITPEMRRAVAKLLSGEECSICNRVAELLASIGLIVQTEHPVHEPRVTYPLFRGTFVDRARDLFGDEFVNKYNPYGPVSLAGQYDKTLKIHPGIRRKRKAGQS